ncbi:MAG: M23 family metallopeptidase [Candidatus Dormibacteraeota bacterium]|nr:M23 family metallopeptidase [Candidatus Dormibacteraeota bacterium]
MAAPIAAALARAAGKRLLAGAAARRSRRGWIVGCGGCLLATAICCVVAAVLVSSLAVLLSPATALSLPVGAFTSASAGVAPIDCPGLSASQGYGYTPYEHPHTGIDLVCPAGTPVTALAAGTFHRRQGPDVPCAFPSGRSGGLGIYGELDSGAVTFLYGHLEGFGVPDGSRVAAGNVLGFEGSTGCSSGFHLHFEVDLNGRAANPCPFLPAGYPAAHNARDDRCWGDAPP